MKTRIAILFAFCVSSAVPPAYASGISTAFADVQLLNIPVGVPYNLSRQRSKPLDLKNLGDVPLTVQIEVIKPAPGDVKSGAEAIPSAAWITIQPREIELGPHQTSSSDVIITVPKSKAYRGKQYQVMIWSKGRPAGASAGIRVNAALLSRLRFTTAP